MIGSPALTSTWKWARAVASRAVIVNRCLQVEHHPVRQGSVGDLPHRGEHAAGIAGRGAGLQVDVAGGAALPECGQQHAALEHEPRGEGCLCQPGEEALQNLKLDQLADGPTGRRADGPGGPSRVDPDRPVRRWWRATVPS